MISSSAFLREVIPAFDINLFSRTVPVSPRLLGTPCGAFSGAFLTRFNASGGAGDKGAGVESDPSAVRMRSVCEDARGGNGFLSRGGPDEGLPTLLLGAALRSPSLGVKGREPVLGVRLRPPGRGVKLLPAGLGVKLRPPGRGVRLRPAGLGVKLRPVGLGVRLRPAGLGVRLRELVLGVMLREPVLGVKLREPARGVADRGALLNPSRGFVMRGRAAEDGPSFLAGPPVRLTSFESVEDAGFAL